MLWWSSARPSPPPSPSNSVPSPPPRESTTSSRWCSNTGSPRLPRRRTHSTVRWAAPSSSALGWTRSWSVVTCFKRHIRSTGKAAHLRHLSQPKQILKCRALMVRSLGQRQSASWRWGMGLWRRSTEKWRSSYLPSSGHREPAYLCHFGQSATMKMNSTSTYLQPQF